MIMLAGVPVQGILFTVFQSICQVFLLCLAGFALSFNGIVDKPTSKTLNHLNVALFTPALLFSKVAFFLSPAKLRQLWVIPIFFTILTGLSALTAHCLARVFRLKRSQVNFATAASMFMNSNSLPVALMQSLATTVPLLKWGPDDTTDAMFGRSLTYLVVFSTLGMILRWSYGIRLLSRAEDVEPTTVANVYRDNDTDEPHPVLTSVIGDSSDATRLINYETDPNLDAHDQHLRRTHPLRSRLPHPRITPVSRRYTYPHVRPHSHLPVVPTSLGDRSESEESDEIETTEGESEDTIALRPEATDTGFSTDADDASLSPAALPPASSPESSPGPHPHIIPRWDRAARPSPSFWTRLRKFLTSLSPPLVASLSALFVVLVPPLQRFLTSRAMIPLKGALDNAGACSVPLTLIVLGGWFWDDASNAKRKGGRTNADIQGTSDGQGKAKRKGQAGHDRPASTAEHALRPDTVGPARNASTASLTSIIGAFGDVLMARVRPRGGAGRVGRHARPDEDDVEQGRLAAHFEERYQDQAHTNGACASRPRSRSRSQSRADLVAVNGRARQSPISTTHPVLVPPPLLSQKRPCPDPLPHAPATTPPGETLTVFVSLLARMVVVPLVVTPLMVFASRLGWGGDVFADPVFLVSSMLLVASPPALTLAQISQRAKTPTTAGSGGDANAFSPFERLLSRTVFWAYLVLTPPITIISVMVGLLMIGAR